MRNLLLVATALAILGCASTVPMSSPSADVAAKALKPAEGYARIYVARKSQWYGSAILFHADVDGKAIGGLAPATYRFVDVTPGKHVVRVHGNENEETIEIEARANQVYYAVVHARSGLMTARVAFDSPTTDGAAVVRESTLAQ